MLQRPCSLNPFILFISLPCLHCSPDNVCAESLLFTIAYTVPAHFVPPPSPSPPHSSLWLMNIAFYFFRTSHMYPPLPPPGPCPSYFLQRHSTWFARMTRSRPTRKLESTRPAGGRQRSVTLVTDHSPTPDMSVLCPPRLQARAPLVCNAHTHARFGATRFFHSDDSGSQRACRAHALIHLPSLTSPTLHSELIHLHSLESTLLSTLNLNALDSRRWFSATARPSSARRTKRSPT